MLQPCYTNNNSNNNMQEILQICSYGLFSLDGDLDSGTKAPSLPPLWSEYFAGWFFSADLPWSLTDCRIYLYAHISLQGDLTFFILLAKSSQKRGIKIALLDFCNSIFENKDLFGS